MSLSGCFFEYADSVSAGVVNTSWHYTQLEVHFWYAAL